MPTASTTKVTERVVRPTKPKTNIVPWTSDEKIGLRTNWPSTIAFIVAVAVTFMWHGELSGWSALALVLLAGTGFLIRFLLTTKRAALAFIIGCVVTLVVLVIAYSVHIPWRDVWVGVVIAICFACTALTSWWPPFAPSKNRKN